MKRLLGGVYDGWWATGELLGYVALNLDNMKPEQYNIEQTKQLANAGQLVNAKLENDELVGTESSIKRLNTFNPSMRAMGDIKYTVLQIMTVKDKPVRVVLTDAYGVPKIVDYEEALQRISDKGAINAKIVTHENKRIISAILGELPRKEISLVETKEKAKKPKLRARYINDKPALNKTILWYSNSHSDTGCTTRIGDKIVINYSNVLGISNYAYGGMRRLAEKINGDEAYRKVRAHYPNTFNEIAKSGIPKRDLGSTYELAQATNNFDSLTLATLKDFVIYSLVSKVDLVKDKNILSMIKELLVSVSATTDKDEITFACHISDSITTIGVKGKELIDTAYIIAYSKNGSKLPSIYKKYNDYLVESVKGWKNYTLGSKKVDHYANLLVNKMVQKVTLNGAVLSISDRGALEYTKNGNTIELDRPVSSDLETTEVIGLYKENDNLYRVVRADTNGVVDTTYGKFVIVRGDKILFGIKELLYSEMYKGYMFTYRASELVVVKSYDGTLYSRYIPNHKVSTKRYYYGIDMKFIAEEVGKNINDTNYDKLEELITSLIR